VADRAVELLGLAEIDRSLLNNCMPKDRSLDEPSQLRARAASRPGSHSDSSSRLNRATSKKLQ
jgi:hypothetical protein